VCCTFEPTALAVGSGLGSDPGTSSVVEKIWRDLVKTGKIRDANEYSKLRTY
jgi:hypothetical protein